MQLHRRLQLEQQLVYDIFLIIFFYQFFSSENVSAKCSSFVDQSLIAYFIFFFVFEQHFVG